MLDLQELSAICQQHGISCMLGEKLASHITFRVGGECPALLTVNTVSDAKLILQYLRANQAPHALIGRGSNLLVPDQGYPGIVVKLGGELATKIQTDTERGTITAAAGLNLRKLCVAALQASLSGLEFAYGIPGTVGGAVYMNAGAYGGDFGGVLERVRILDARLNDRVIQAKELDLRYRHSAFMDALRGSVILSATVKLTNGNAKEIRAKMQELLGKRQAKQPLEYPSAGSTFKRPNAPDVYASKLIDDCGLKGYRVGDAQVSTKHAGFVINRGSATYAEIIAVCKHVQEVVEAQTGYRLELEPEILEVVHNSAQ